MGNTKAPLSPVLLSMEELEQSSVVANCQMNRERSFRGPGSYEQELRIDLVSYIEQRLATESNVLWVDLCCGSGRALAQASEFFATPLREQRLRIIGIDLVDYFENSARQQAKRIPDGLTLHVASVHQWEPPAACDLVTCIHGLHYVADKLDVMTRALRWLKPEAMFWAQLDLRSLRSANNRPLNRAVLAWFREQNIEFHSHFHRLQCRGPRDLLPAFRWLGANDQAGPNYTGQSAVDSIYEPIQKHVSNE
jgi:ubiquinone/menaquinone biosynthesis C-methylase UbiE